MQVLVEKGSVGDSDHDELTKVHLVTSQVLKSYLLWLERSKHRRQNHTNALEGIRSIIEDGIASIVNSISHGKNRNRHDNALEKDSKTDEGSVVKTKTLYDRGEKVEKSAETGVVYKGTVPEDDYYQLKKQLIERTMEAKMWKNSCESLKVETEALKSVVDSLSRDAKAAEKSKVAQAEKEVLQWRKRSEVMQKEMWALKRRLKDTAFVSTETNQSNARVKIMQTQLESLRQELQESKMSMQKTCSRAQFNELVATYESCQAEKDRLAVELVNVMSERDQLLQEKERTMWKNSQEHENAIMEMQAYLEAERAKVMALTKQVTEGKNILKKQHVKYASLEDRNKRDLEVLDKCNRRLQIEKNGQVIAVTKAEQKFQGCLRKLRLRFALRWMDLTKSLVLRVWHRYVSKVRVLKSHSNIAERFFCKYETIRIQSSMLKWKKFVETRLRTKHLLRSSFRNYNRRGTLQAYRRWHAFVISFNKTKKYQQHNEEKSSIILSKLRSQRLKKLLQTWHNYTHLICRKRRAMLGTCVHEASNTASGLATMGAKEFQVPIRAAICAFPSYPVKLYPS